MDRIGKLDRRIAFYSPISSSGGYGGTEYGWNLEFEVWTNVRYLKGGESVMAGRLEGKRPVVLTLRKSIDSVSISSNWKCNFDHMDFNIREAPKQSDDRLYVEFMVEGGVAVGN
tara:strand:- start:1839 stop:2180 length:342 start_codon:yes stop_codon:yes gene_type:complete